MPVGLVIVAHSQRLAEGVREVALQMTGGSVTIEAAGGVAGGALGTDAEAIARAIAAADSPDGVLVLMDLGSAVLSTEMAVEMLGDRLQGRVVLSDAPLVEGAVVAAVEASIGRSLDEVAQTALDARQMTKVKR
ncbi:dihydroxyacetone kinase phosphoryl donor subunit DhaM [Sphaerobacter thermophilus]|uniref:phosphoenolpyruvate--glycerone phosphotransferase n=1 Tax=Sphaerobacter thermophilus (strain ATCC 49802 / DSM 20745 / KCCM 41009 / NCIMB 13125 / S 6022) TaxID=479434 RepID=D1C9M7_SPHTD|nr:dihydroxyacetone kinase phosphoryl donor subunit DhaM [Sphaerobacter thermophilus]ACZ40520.1 dihydroxyacetone kinase, phosphotransfer subunit [Sphaerobacter thermophilus DSM 20745]PZN63256.1 MAG: PTS-dependent dihydroxyacetone kinase phosphotransferase subunit DhaM [Sphaerobacter thermophilus]